MREGHALNKDSGSTQGLSRRKAFKRAAGLATVGVAGASVLSETFATPARAASKSAAVLASTTIQQGALAPTVVILQDAATIAVDASAGNDFRVTLAASRTLGNPANPADGQKITFQITQGSGGSAAITWDADYEFSVGLPQPTLSTTAGQTDLIGFVYNAAKGKWLCAAFVSGFSSTTVTPPAGTYRLFPSTDGPSSPVTYSGSFMAGVLFQVTSGGTWLDGYWWWVCPSEQSTSAQTFALWAVYNDGTGALVTTATVTSGTLTPGQWNYIPLSTPIALSIGACYNACTGFSGNFPDTQNQFGAGDPYSAGIVNGPLAAFSDQSGSAPAPFSMSQGVYGVSGTDPTAMMPANGDVSDNLWMDVQVGTTAPTGTSYRLWPNYPQLPGAASGGSPGYTLATEFQLSASCNLDNIWFYSGSGATVLPTRCAIWDVATQSEVSGTDNASPSWSGAAGSGWVSCAYTGVTLPAGDYKVSVFSADTTDNWFMFTVGYWASGGPAGNGITSGPLTAPGLAGATSPGQGTYNPATWGYPDTFGTAGDGENYWVDAEVTPT
jgi:hypothetical protein